MSKDPSWLADVKAAFDKYSIPPEVWVPIMLHESNAHPEVEHNSLGQANLPVGTIPEWSVGLFQINVAAILPGKPDEQAKLAAQLKDPVFNATYAAKKMAPAWAAVKDIAANSNPSTWSWLVGVRSGWPGGSVQYPFCQDGRGLKSYCDALQYGFSSFYTKWIDAWNAEGAGFGLIAPYFDKIYGTAATAATNAGQSAYNSVTTAPGYFGGAVAGVASTVAGPGQTINAAGERVQAAAGSVAQTIGGDIAGSIGQALTDWAGSQSAENLVIFVIGFILFAGAVIALFLKSGAGKATVAATKGAIKTGAKAAVVGAAAA